LPPLLVTLCPALDPANATVARALTASMATPRRPNLFTMLLSLVPLKAMKTRRSYAFCEKREAISWVSEA
jgi:hypothetical protein